MFANPRTNPHPGTALRRFDGATGARLAAALIACLVALPAFAQAVAVSGTVVDAIHGAPLPAARVRLVDLTTDRPVASAITNEVGRFRVVGLRAGSYAVVVELGDELYWVPDPLVLAADGDPTLTLLVRQANSGDGPPSRPGSGGVWSNPTTATLVAIGGAIVLGVILSEIANDEPEAQASDF